MVKTRRLTLTLILPHRGGGGVLLKSQIPCTLGWGALLRTDNMRKKARILITDDDLSQRKSMSLILDRQGYDVSTARDGLEAVEEVKERDFDVIFLDIKMPRMDGLEAYRNIKQIRPEAVVLMMTAQAVEDLVEDLLGKGVYGVLHKPLDMDVVLKIIDEILERKEKHHSNPSGLASGF
jgi:DNA-binding NtrC family response regulator